MESTFGTSNFKIRSTYSFVRNRSCVEIKPGSLRVLRLKKNFAKNNKKNDLKKVGWIRGTHGSDLWRVGKY
jgi:hypothetical protein